jgi:hypothetical protein
MSLNFFFQKTLSVTFIKTQINSRKLNFKKIEELVDTYFWLVVFFSLGLGAETRPNF